MQHSELNNGRIDLRSGDCLESLRDMVDNSVDSIVTDPPYGLSFMGKRWDYDVPGVDVWAECLRVLKPGGHLLAFAGTRTQHRMAVRIEDAGFEIRDMIAWVYGSGFPKSLDVSDSAKRALGTIAHGKSQGFVGDPSQITAPATDAARQWQGWGTALKPALEPITVARKPLVGTVAANVLAHGTGALNIDGCRVGSEGGTAKANIRKGEPNGERAGTSMGENISFRCDTARLDAGRWPANLIHDGSDEVLAAFPQAQGQQGKTGKRKQGAVYGTVTDGGEGIESRGDTGSAARFFYCAKASKRDRGAENNHPTVKPTDLMRYLIRLVTPPGGTVLDPFMGSGSTGKAAMLEGFNFIGCERDAQYIEIAEQRIRDAQPLPDWMK